MSWLGKMGRESGEEDVKVWEIRKRDLKTTSWTKKTTWRTKNNEEEEEVLGWGRGIRKVNGYAGWKGEGNYIRQAWVTSSLWAWSKSAIGLGVRTSYICTCESPPLCSVPTKKKSANNKAQFGNLGYSPWLAICYSRGSTKKDSIILYMNDNSY